MASALAPLFYAGLGADEFIPDLPFLFYFVATASVIVLTILLLSLDYCTGLGDDEGSLKTKFYVLFEYNVKRAFKSQTRETYNTILHGMRTIFSRHCSRPTVLAFVVEPGASQTAHDLATKVAQVAAVTLNSPLSVNDVPHKSIIHGLKYASPDSFTDFYHKLNSVMNETKCAILVDFEFINGQVANTLCNLLDEGLLPCKAAIIILLNLGASLLNGDSQRSREPSEIAEKHISFTMGGHMYSSRTTQELQRALCGRAAFIKAEEVFKKTQQPKQQQQHQQQASQTSQKR